MVNYSLSIPSSIGIITYYNQTDARWGSTMYGGNDPISIYGCGPTVLSMLVSSFTEQEITPDAMAAWARDNHYWVSTSGSAHALIPEGAAYYGLSVEPFSDYTEQGMIQALHDKSIFVALVVRSLYLQRSFYHHCRLLVWFSCSHCRSE